MFGYFFVCFHGVASPPAVEEEANRDAGGK
jgi:hypothetical protein